jgi:hypothetical protein
MPCLNNGTCTLDPDNTTGAGYNCTCPQGYTGVFNLLVPHPVFLRPQCLKKEYAVSFVLGCVQMAPEHPLIACSDWDRIQIRFSGTAH